VPEPSEDAKTIADLAVERGWVTPEQLQEAMEVMAKLAAMGVPEELGRVLVKKGLISDAQLKELESRGGPKQPATIGGFEILARLGRGGMGAVYKARQISMDRIVALKVLPPALARDESFVERFLREARVVAKLNHPNIVQGIDVGTADKYHYFAMEYVEGETVQELIAREGAMAERRALDIVLQIAHALHHAHRHGMVHRDIKPDNIMLTTAGVAKLCDLGLAKSMAGDSTLTQTGMAVGTPHYLSPEQARGDHDVDIRSDIYSLGATLYHLVLGRTPFSGSSAAVVMTKHLSEEPKDPREVRPELSAGLAALVLRMMAKDREDRQQSPEALINDIGLVIAGKLPAGARAPALAKPGKAAVPRPASRRTTARPVAAVPAGARNRGAVLAAAIFLALAGAGLAAWLALSDKDPTGSTALPPPQSGTERPRVDPEAEAARKRLAELAARYQDALARSKAGPSTALIAEFERLARDAAGTVYEGKARAEADRLIAAQKPEPTGEDVLARAKAQADALEKQDKFGEALKLYDGVPIPVMLRERTRIEALAQGRFDMLKAEANRILAAGKYDEKNAGAFDEAARCLNRAAGFGLLKIDDQLKAELAALQSAHEARLVERDKQLAAARAGLRAAFVEKRRAVFAAAARLEPDAASGQLRMAGALKLAQETLAVEEYKPFAAEATRIVRDLQALDALLGKLPEMIRPRRGTQVKIASDDRGPEEGSLEEIKPAGLDLRPKGMPAGSSVSIAFRKIAPACLAELAGLSATTPSECYLTGILAFYAGRPGDALEPLGVAARQPALKGDAEYYLGLARAAQKVQREKKAGDKLQECRDKYRQCKEGNVPDGDPRWAALRDELDKLLKDYADTDAVKQNRGDEPEKKDGK
jgi:predicted Ser/Thr protein kinase